MQIEADPNQLRYTASLFSNGVNELRQKSKHLEDIRIGLTQGEHNWKGEAAQGFSTTMEKIQNEIQQKAGVLEEAAQILNQFAQQMDHVNQLRDQAMRLERTLWSITGDSESAFHERQSISYQINQLQQEAEWQANAADAQALSAFQELSIPMPDFDFGTSHSSGNLNDELEGLTEIEKSYYRRHRDLIGDSDETDSDLTDQPMDKATLTAVLIQYLKSKEPDYLPDDYRQKAAMQDFNMLYGGLSEDELAATIQNIYDSEKQGQHFQQEIQSGNYDQNALIREPGYTQYAMNQAFQQEPLSGIQGVVESMGLTKAFGGGDGSDNIDQPSNIDENTDNGQTQGIKGTEGADASKGTGKAEFTYKNNPMENPKAAKDILENPDAVYGYSPNPNSTRIGKFAHKIDWTDPKQVEIARKTRLAYHENNEQMLENLYCQGYSTEDIARKMVNERNANRLQSYLDRGDIEGYEIAKKSNLDTYQNANGPTPESMFEKYGSWQGVIDASVRSNPGMDACVGLYDDYHGGK